MIKLVPSLYGFEVTEIQLEIDAVPNILTSYSGADPEIESALKRIGAVIRTEEPAIHSGLPRDHPYAHP